MVGLIIAGVIAVFILLVLASSIRILREYERGVIFRLGRLIAQKGPGLILLIPIVDQMVRIDLRTMTLNVPPQEVITQDNVTVRVNAVAYFRVIDPNKAVTEVENYLLATSQIAQTTLRSVLGKAELDALLSERERLNAELQQIIDEQTEPWGIKVSTVEVKDVELPADMQRAMSRQAEAERERRAKIIAADGEFQAAEKLSQAANIISEQPGDAAAALSADAGRDRGQQQLDDRLPTAARPDQAAGRAACQAERAAALATAAPAFRAALSAPRVRIDQLTGLRAILAPGRAERPEAFAPAIVELRPDAAERCPFCEGREDRTPPEVWADRPQGGDPDTPGWLARAVPNLYPVLDSSDEQPPTSNEARAAEGGFSAPIDPLAASVRGPGSDLFASQPADGSHEVIVNTPEHATSLAQLTDSQLAAALGGWRERMRAHEQAAYLHLIVNEGPEAGASLEHTHAQLYALPFVPAEVARERERAGAYHERTMGSHLLEDVATEEVRRRERLVAIDDEALLICPWASRSPFELRVIPRRAEPRFEQGRGGRRDDRHRAPGAHGRARLAPSAQPLGPNRSPGCRRVRLAPRHPAATHRASRVRARHRGRDRRLPAGAGGGRPARGARLAS